MITAMTRLPKSTIELTITLSWKDVQKTYDEVLKDIAKDIELPGFRKGKAPKDLVKKSIKRDILYEKILSRLIPQAYIDAVKEHGLKPIINPKVAIISADEDKDWTFKITTCEAPEVDLGNYREKIDNLFAKEKIWVPGKDEKKPEDSSKKKDDYLQQVLNILLETTKVDIPDILIEDEANRLLANLLDQTQKIGLTVEQYLASRNLTTEQLRQQYANQARMNLEIEFILGKIADKENITVPESEIDSLIEKTSDPQEKDTLKNQKGYLISVLRRQKTLDALVKPIV